MAKTTDLVHLRRPMLKAVGSDEEAVRGGLPSLHVRVVRAHDVVEEGEEVTMERRLQREGLLAGAGREGHRDRVAVKVAYQTLSS